MASIDSATVSVAASNELRLQLGDNDDLIAQKIVSQTEGPSSTHWSYAWLLEAGCIIFESKDLRTKFPDAINLLGWVLYSSPDNPSREEIANALLLVMGVWLKACIASDTCLAPPSTKFLEDRELRKVLQKVKSLQEEVAEYKLAGSPGPPK